MSAFGGKVDMLRGSCLLLRSQSGVKRTSPIALHMSAFDPKRTLMASVRPDVRTSVAPAWVRPRSLFIARAGNFTASPALYQLQRGVEFLRHRSHPATPS